ncbi:MAG: sigma-70 family RNA polymerase sigma factor [Spirochaetota bacterium]
MSIKTYNRATIDSNSLNLYLSNIQKDQLLDAHEEKKLSRRIRSGDNKAREELINSNLRLVVKIARGYSSRDMDLQDLIQEGNLGLIKAAEKFDFRRNVRFSTYASFWIKQSITRAITNKSKMIRLPHRKEEKLRRINYAHQKLSQDSGTKPHTSELSTETSITEKEIRNILRLPDKVVSIETSGVGYEYNLENTMEDPRYNPDFLVMRNYLKSKTTEMMNILSEKEKKVLLLRYSFLSGQKYTLKEISRMLEISPETVRQTEMKALKKIREHFHHLKEFLKI